MKSAFALAAVLLSPLVVHAITIDTVPVGNPVNPGEFSGIGIFGAVSTTYRIATTEVTNAQYVEFLNAVAATDPNLLFNSTFSFYSRYGIQRSGSSGSYSYSVKPDVPEGGPGGTNYTYGDKPVVFVSWYDAARFVNWLNNGATAGASTETGAYTMSTGANVARNSGAVWYLPNEDQWYKAAYHKNDGVTGHYWTYPTANISAPDNNQPSADSGNSANYLISGNYTQDESYPTTAVGAYTVSESAYGTFDQGGNVWEWTETTTSSGTTRVRRGGAFDTTDMSSLARQTRTPDTENENMGFRIASIALLPGDYNANGIVDAADYVVWRKKLNQSVLLPNDITQGTVTPADYDVWRMHFGQTPATVTGSASLLQNAVPEPATLPLLATVVLIWLALRTRRVSRLFSAES